MMLILLSMNKRIELHLSTGTVMSNLMDRILYLKQWLSEIILSNAESILIGIGAIILAVAITALGVYNFLITLG